MVPRPKVIPVHGTEDDHERFIALKGGDAAALEAIFHRYADRLCAFVFAYTQSRDVAEEIVQEVFVWLWEHRTAIEPPRSLAAYLHVAARNRALNHRRDRVTELRVYDGEAKRPGARVTPTPLDAPDALAEAHDLNDALGRAVAAMPLRCREVFTLARVSGLTYMQIADVLGLSPKTVEIHMSRALALLRVQLAPWLAD